MLKFINGLHFLKSPSTFTKQIVHNQLTINKVQS